jgi:hypothetical protein
MTLANGILDALAIDEIKGLIPVPLPSAMSLSEMFLPLDFAMALQDHGPDNRAFGFANYTAEQLFDLKSTARSNPQNVYWADSINGSDSGGTGGSEATAFQSLGKAISTGKTAGQPFKVKWKGGGAPSQDAVKTKNFTTGSGAETYNCDVDFCVEFYNGFGVVGTHVDFSAPALHTGASYTYVLVDSALDNILDRSALDRDGFLNPRYRVPYVASGDIPAGTWAYNGTNTLVRRSDNAPVTNANTRFIQSVPNFRNTYNVSIGLFPATPSDVLTIEGGGSHTSPFHMIVDSARTDLTPRCVALKNVRSAGYGHLSTGAGRSFSIDGLHGLAVLENCMGAKAKTDHFSLHNTRGGSLGGVKSRLLTINCKGRGNGRERRYPAGETGAVINNDSSCNSWTLHADGMGIDLAGDFGDASGGCVRNIGTSKALLAGTAMHDIGDRWLGSTTQPTGARTQDTAEIYAFRSRMPDMPPGSIAFNNQGGVIALRDCWPSRAVNIGTIVNW